MCLVSRDLLSLSDTDRDDFTVARHGARMRRATARLAAVTTNPDDRYPTPIVTGTPRGRAQDRASSRIHSDV